MQLIARCFMYQMHYSPKGEEGKCLVIGSPEEKKKRIFLRDFPDSSVGKESACNAGDPGLIPGLGRSAGEGIGYPLQYS